VLGLFGLAVKETVIEQDVADIAANRFMKRIRSLSDGQLRINRKDNEKSLEPMFDGLDGLCKKRRGKMEPFWMDAIDLRFFRSTNLHQRMYAVGEFIWYSKNRADNSSTKEPHRGKDRYLNNVTYIRFLIGNRVVEDLFDPNRMNIAVLKKCSPLLMYLSKCYKKGGVQDFTSGPNPEAWNREWLPMMLLNATNQSDSILAKECFRIIQDVCANFINVPTFSTVNGIGRRGFSQTDDMTHRCGDIVCSLFKTANQLLATAIDLDALRIKRVKSSSRPGTIAGRSTDTTPVNTPSSTPNGTPSGTPSSTPNGTPMTTPNRTTTTANNDSPVVREREPSPLTSMLNSLSMFLKCWDKKGILFRGIHDSSTPNCMGVLVTNEMFALGWRVMWLLNEKHTEKTLMDLVVTLFVEYTDEDKKRTLFQLCWNTILKEADKREEQGKSTMCYAFLLKALIKCRASSKRQLIELLNNVVKDAEAQAHGPGRKAENDKNDENEENDENDEIPLDLIQIVLNLF
jgi:hypothetical protein